MSGISVYLSTIILNVNVINSQLKDTQTSKLDLKIVFTYWLSIKNASLA